MERPEFSGEVLFTDPVDEGFLAVDEDDGDALFVAFKEVGVGRDVDRFQGEGHALSDVRDSCFGDVAEVAVRFGVEGDAGEGRRFGHGLGQPFFCEKEGLRQQGCRRLLER